MNKKEKYIYDSFINSINVNSSFGKIVERINIKKVVLNKKIKTYKYFKTLIEFSFVLVFACIFALSINEKSNNIDSALSIAETATNESTLTNENMFIIFNNEKYELSVITKENFDFDETTIESTFTFNNQEYYILKESNNTLILYTKSDNTFYLATKIN